MNQKQLRTDRKDIPLDEVDEAGIESFPASDPPSYNMPGRGKGEAEKSNDEPATADDHATPERSPMTTAAMRDAIPSGRTIGRTSAREPSTAPFDTDDEAAGRPAQADAIATTVAHEQASQHFVPRKHRTTPQWPYAVLVVAGLMIVFVLLMSSLA